jgi:hypothetical protein
MMLTSYEGDHGGGDHVGPDHVGNDAGSQISRMVSR